MDPPGLHWPTFIAPGARIEQERVPVRVGAPQAAQAYASVRSLTTGFLGRIMKNPFDGVSRRVYPAMIATIPESGGGVIQPLHL
jgi:hypothetical protein